MRAKICEVFFTVLILAVQLKGKMGTESPPYIHITPEDRTSVPKGMRKKTGQTGQKPSVRGLPHNFPSLLPERNQNVLDEKAETTSGIQNKLVH